MHPTCAQFRRLISRRAILIRDTPRQLPRRNGVRAAVLAALCVSAIASCGGGRASPPVAEPMSFTLPEKENGQYSTAKLPPVTSQDVRRMPIYHDGRGYLFVGLDQRFHTRLGTRTDAERGNTGIEFGTTPTVVTDKKLRRYLSYKEYRVFEMAPSLYFENSSGTIADRERVLTAVQILNASLPKEHKIRILSNFPKEQHGTISVEFIPTSEEVPLGQTVVTRETYKTIAYAEVRISDTYANLSEERALHTILHELIHALGLTFHPFPTHPSILVSTHEEAHRHKQEQPLSILFPIDRAMLNAMYRGEPPYAFGPWEEESLHIHGMGTHAGFGVALRNGHAEPYSYGYQPTRNFVDSPGMQSVSNVSWEGTLIGLTPDSAAVVGDAAIHVNVSTLAGTANFVSLESWTPYLTPGEKGTGTKFLDGGLNYHITVDGNTFRETGGDKGILTGIFTGQNHEGAAGTLERDDLTAAFGATR